jgi:hypothetical protein
VWDDLVLVYFEGEVWKQEIEHLGFKAQYSNIYDDNLDQLLIFTFMQTSLLSFKLKCSCFPSLLFRPLGL